MQNIVQHNKVKYMPKGSKLAHYKYLLAKEKEVRAKEQEFIMELLKDKKLLELENIRLKKGKLI